MRRLARRRFLQGLGGAAVALPMLDAWRGAGRSQDVQRYVQLFTPLGMSPARWYDPVGADGFELTEWAGALRPHASDMLIARGFDTWNGATGHHQGVGATFTGRSESGGYGVSLDQLIAREIGHTPFPSLNFGFFTTSDTSTPGETQTVFADANRPIVSENDPRAMFTTLFGGGTTSGEEAVTAAHARRRSVLDLVRDDYADAEVGLSTGDRRRLRNHAEYIRSLEMSLDSMGPSCGGGDAAAFTIPLEAENGAAISRAQSQLLALSLACDMTRVATLQWSHAISGLRYHWLESLQPGISTKNHHGWTHPPSSGDWTQGQLNYQEIERWHLGEVAFLVDELKRLDVFEGTAVLWGTNEPRGPHSDDEEGRGDLVYALFGDLGGHFHTGKVIDVQTEGYVRPESRVDLAPSLLLGVAQAFGFSGDSFGDPYRCQAGVLPGLVQ